MNGQTKCTSRDQRPKNKCQEGETGDQVKETRAVLDLFKGWKFLVGRSTVWNLYKLYC